MNVGYKHTPYNYQSSTASGLKGPPFPQKHRPAKFSGYVLVYMYNDHKQLMIRSVAMLGYCMGG